ncbi:MAG TPA: nucleotidyltransferase domain-containing protein [Pseudonocardiaceae bacterium]|jgi:hypothetical protein|nr:nucleotidyltransferase domain-containing protein [Pseudonocardiaceae bacterium]
MTGEIDTEAAEASAELVRRHTVLSVVVGPTASGLDSPDAADDSDGAPVRGVFVPPTELFWRFAKPPSTVDGPDAGWASWEVETFCVAGLTADPTALEVLASPLVRTSTDIGAELRALTVAFLSQRAADACRRATAADFARAEAAMAAGGTPRWRQVAEVIRVLMIGETLVRTGELTIDLSAQEDELRALRAGELPWPDVRQWVDSLRNRTAEAVIRSPLPALPNRAAVQHWLASVRRRGLTD